ncbi:MAG: hypothetical protein ACI4AA_10860 [Lachnospiraceae bacterium]
MHKTLSRDEKLEQIMRLREYQRNNASHVNTLAGIASPGNAYTDEETPNQDRTDGKSRFYGRFRLVLSVLLFGALCMYHFTLESENGTFTKNLQTAIQRDYSHKVIDFVEDFTYTLDYEKTSIN